MNDEHRACLSLYDIHILNQQWKGGSSYSYEKKSRPYWGICFVISGRIKYRTENGCVQASAGDMVVLDKNIRYRAVFEGELTEDILINFHVSGCEDRLWGGKSSRPIILRNCMYAKQKFMNILKYAFMNDRQYKIKSILYDILDDIYTYKNGESEHNRIKKILDEDIKCLLSESEVAMICSISVSTLQRQFKRIYGKTLSSYRNELRIIKAKEMLISRKYSIEEIAEQLGFCDGAYFSRCFKKVEGCSPKEYLKRHYTM